MSTLIVQLPEHRRLRPAAADAGLNEPVRRREYAYVTSDDGLAFEALGETAAALLPRRHEVVAAVREADVSWHRIVLPKAPPARLRSALVGVLEEALLEDADAVHLAVAPQATPGSETWVAALDGGWLRDELDALQRDGIFVDRVVPMAWPDEPPTGHFHSRSASDGGGRGDVVLTWASAAGVATVRLDSGFARAVVPDPAPAATRWTASPLAAAVAERWRGAPVAVMPIEQRLLQSARSLWDFRQFEFARKTRGARAARDWLRQATSPAWRPVRVGLACLIAVQVIGLNAWAWHQRNAIEARRATIEALVRSTFPRVSDNELKLDATAVMLRETQALRTQAGKPGEIDLEPMLLAAAAAWPAERPPVENLRFEPGRLTFAASGWSDSQVEQFRSLLHQDGWRVEVNEGRLIVSRPSAVPTA